MALNPHGLEIARFDGPAAFLASFEEARSDKVRFQLAVFGGFPLQETAKAVKAIRAHPLAGEARLLVVEERLSPEQSAVLLDAGADDCYNRAFLPQIFSARARGLLRRAAPEAAVEDPAVSLTVALGLTLHLLERRLKVEGKDILLTRVQFDLLAALLRERPRPVAHAALAAALSRAVVFASKGFIAKEVAALRPLLGRWGSCLGCDEAGNAWFTPA